MMTGTVIAQIIALATQPVVARLYSDHQLGLLATFMAVPMIVGTVAALRYDMAIVLPQEESEASSLLRFSLIASGVAAALLTVVAIIGREGIAGRIGEEGLSPWVWLIGPMALLLSWNTILAFWLNRHADFSGIASKNVVLSGVNAATRIGLAVGAVASFFSLVLSQALALIAAFAYMVT
ncbi:MAG: oligosaccharide flippase family protein, partial [Brachybacterium sp.]|nr:oligosaccharide flippase family protein [Brachybacterium sp.]